jgi:surface antigen
VRWANSYPFGISSGSQWATNWQLSAGGVLVGKKPKAGAYIVTQDGIRTIRAFQDPEAAAAAFRAALPGESGQRNILQGQGFFGLDTGVAKAWKITERQALKFRWEVFNVTNTPRFDAATASASLTNTSDFGKYAQTLSDKRVMQFALRYEF